MAGKMQAHLAMIQGVVNRLAQSSFLLKGWSVVLVSALLAFADGDHRKFPESITESTHPSRLSQTNTATTSGLSTSAPTQPHPASGTFRFAGNGHRVDYQSDRTANRRRLNWRETMYAVGLWADQQRTLSPQDSPATSQKPNSEKGCASTLIALPTAGLSPRETPCSLWGITQKTEMCG